MSRLLRILPAAERFVVMASPPNTFREVDVRLAAEFAQRVKELASRVLPTHAHVIKLVHRLHYGGVDLVSSDFYFGIESRNLDRTIK